MVIIAKQLFIEIVLMNFEVDFGCLLEALGAVFQGNRSRDPRVMVVNNFGFGPCKQLNSRWLTAESMTDIC